MTTIALCIRPSRQYAARDDKPVELPEAPERVRAFVASRKILLTAVLDTEKGRFYWDVASVGRKPPSGLSNLPSILRELEAFLRENLQ